MNFSIITMSILLAFGIWTLASEPRLKFTDHPETLDAASPAPSVSSRTTLVEPSWQD